MRKCQEAEVYSKLKSKYIKMKKQGAGAEGNAGSNDLLYCSSTRDWQILAIIIVVS
jgi:hypothetical protein